MAEPDPSIWKRMEKNGLVYYRATSDNGIPYYWSGKDSNAAQWDEPVPVQTIKVKGKKEVIIGREPKQEYRKEYDDLLKLSLKNLQKEYGEYKERAEFKLKKVVNIIRPLLAEVPQGLTDKEEENLAEISNEKERAGKRRVMIEKRLKNRQAHNSIRPEETAKLQQVVDMYDNWYTLRVPKNENEDIYKENIAKVMVGLLRNFIDYIPTYPKAEDVEPAIQDAELVSEFFSLFPSDVKSKLQNVRGGLVILNKKMGAELLEKHELKGQVKKEFPLPQRKPTRREKNILERNRKIFKEQANLEKRLKAQANLEKNLGKRPRIRPGTKRVFPMSPPPPLGHRSPLREGTLAVRRRGTFAVRRRKTVRERRKLAVRQKETLSTPMLNPHSPLVEQMRIRAPGHTRRGPGAPKVPAAYNSPKLDPHSPLVEETTKKILNITRKLKKGPQNPKLKESALKRFLKTVFFLTRPLFTNTPNFKSDSLVPVGKAKREPGPGARPPEWSSRYKPESGVEPNAVPFKGALVPVGKAKRGPGPGAKPPGFNSSGTRGPVIEPNFECPAGFQPGGSGACVPKPTPPLIPKNLPPAEKKVLEKGCPNKLPLYEVDLQVTKEHHAKGYLCSSGVHFIPEKVLEVGGLSDKAGAHVGNGLHVDDELDGPQNDTKGVCSSESIRIKGISAAEKAAVECNVFPEWQGKRTTWRGEPAYKAAKEVVEHPERFDLTESDVARFKDHFKGKFPGE